MKEHPVLFSGPMVRAIIGGQKTQTRRVVKNPAQQAMLRDDPRLEKDGGALWLKHCPYGNPCDRLWVRETWWKVPTPSMTELREGADTWPKVAYVADDDNPQYLEWGWKRKPSIHMPRWASRLTLEITNVRIEPLNNISEEDAKAEGMGTLLDEPFYESTFMKHRVRFRDLWNSINAKRGFGWDTNPWVWVIEFRRVDA